MLVLTACASEKEIPERGLDYFEAGYQSSWPYPTAQIRRVYRDDTVFYLNYMRSGEGSAPEILNSTHIEGSFALIAQAFDENDFKNIDPFCQVDKDMVAPTDISYNHISANIDGNVVLVVGGCYDGFREISEKRQAFSGITTSIQDIVGQAEN